MPKAELRLSVTARRLWREGREIHLTPKAFDLLALLVERRPDAVSKGEVYARIWPGTFVSEVTLHSLVSELRRLLADDAASPRFLRTVHGFGYAFIGAVDESPAAGPHVQRRLRGWLVGETGRLSLFDGKNLLGRGGGDGVIEVPSSTVSRRHAAIRFAKEARLEDLGSKNGTFLRDVRVTKPVVLADGDPVRLGSLVLTFRLASTPGATTTRSMSRLAQNEPT